MLRRLASTCPILQALVLVVVAKSSVDASSKLHAARLGGQDALLHPHAHGSWRSLV